MSEHPFGLIEGSANWLVPTVWKTNEEAGYRAVFQCRASRAVQNATAGGMGLTFLPCYVGDADPRLIRISDPVESLDLDLWMLTHPDLRNTARIRAVMTFLYDELSAKADLWGGKTKSPGKWNFIPHKGW